MAITKNSTDAMYKLAKYYHNKLNIKKAIKYYLMI